MGVDVNFQPLGDVIFQKEKSSLGKYKLKQKQKGTKRNNFRKHRWIVPSELSSDKIDLDQYVMSLDFCLCVEVKIV